MVSAGPRFDETDAKILQILSHDGRASLQRIAERVKLRRPSVHARVRRLEDEGVILGYRAELDPEALHAGLVAFALLKLDAEGSDCMTRVERVAAELQRIPEVLEVHTIAGDEDVIVKVRCRDVKDMERVIMRGISGVKGVANVKTLVSMSTHLERAVAVRKSSDRKA